MPGSDIVEGHLVINIESDDPDGAAQLRQTCLRNGFALFTVPIGKPSCVALATVAAALGLGDPYVPPMYREDLASYGYSEAGYNRIRYSAVSGHRFFGTADAQGFHTDGTLEPIGYIPTSMLWIEHAAAYGGSTTLFRAVAAFEVLLARDRQMAITMAADDALTRTASSARPPQSATGPAFKDLGDGFRTRWADDGSETWNGSGVTGKRRLAAVDALREMSRPGSPYYAELAIPSGTGLVLRNDIVAHGRTKFADRGGQDGRSVIRALFRQPVAELTCEPP